MLFVSIMSVTNKVMKKCANLTSAFQSVDGIQTPVHAPRFSIVEKLIYSIILDE